MQERCIATASHNSFSVAVSSRVLFYALLLSTKGVVQQLFSFLNLSFSIIISCVHESVFLSCAQFFNNALVVGRSAESEVADHIYDLILELHAIDSSILLSVMPQLEFKLKVCVQIINFAGPLDLFLY